MKKKKEGRVCFKCGASLSLANCPPEFIEDPCDDCGQCSCLRRYAEDYAPETDWIR